MDSDNYNVLDVVQTISSGSCTELAILALRDDVISLDKVDMEQVLAYLGACVLGDKLAPTHSS